METRTPSSGAALSLAGPLHEKACLERSRRGRIPSKPRAAKVLTLDAQSAFFSAISAAFLGDLSDQKLLPVPVKFFPEAPKRHRSSSPFPQPSTAQTVTRNLY
jgi:hypothetical protein